MREKTKLKLEELQQIMQELDLWATVAPNPQALLSTEPFAIDTMTANEWLQWIFIPRMCALLEADLPLPNNISITPYIEEALKELDGLEKLLCPINEIENLLKNQSQ
ncbi:uncharacterized protein YqcC (DUF446 family) [Bisgaardia hudsonensis]|uniref:Uncharacterized protein YqcC (DUF446 family) n=1 Tax=Bisgaardia hudsonensis TaxID=109472 RepID=A0A4R2N172_9PAST|nr:YqcC family protein [Bisgaardia hudsonensis]QLB13117.1 anhydro-N-acetylmuramic acid kinase [Bisgaardia hudsonensis]TCP13312.1 uncharacterized protein YqcC (DUF446 family) [Bisgaardia hudsonensis]